MESLSIGNIIPFHYAMSYDRNAVRCNGHPSCPLAAPTSAPIQSASGYTRTPTRLASDPLTAQVTMVSHRLNGATSRPAGTYHRFRCASYPAPNALSSARCAGRVDMSSLM